MYSRAAKLLLYAETHVMPATARLLFNLNEFAYVD
tara:strand:- start:5347 stop:5451 length:105 start_codon:yes stop_codon:yes gene_type:complete